MISIRKLTTIAFLCIVMSGMAFGQYFSQAMSYEAIRPFVTPGGFGSGAFSLLNNTLINGDISSTQSNPAFLVNIQRPKASLATNSLSGNFSSSLMGTNSDVRSKSSAMNTDYFGFAYPVSVYQGAMVLAVSYEPSAYYYSRLQSDGYSTLAVDTTVYEKMNLKESGAMNTLRFSGAVEFMPNLNIGISLNFYNGNRSCERIEFENDNSDYFSHSTIDYIEIIKPEYNGFNMDLGMTYQSDNFKFGLRISTPLKMHIHELSEFIEDYEHDDGGTESTTTDYNIEYTSLYPWEVAPSLAVKLGPLTLGADLVLHNWQDIEVDQLDNNDDVNRDLYWNLRRTTDISVSAAIPFGKTISTRVAYRRIPSPYEDLQNEDEEISHLLGASVETILMKSLILGASYQHSFGNRTVPHPYFNYSDTSVFSSQSSTEDRITFSLAILL